MNKRGLRLETAQEGDIRRRLTACRPGADAPVRTAERLYTGLAAEGHPGPCTDNLAYYDHVIDVGNERFRMGDIARVDLDRLQLQRVTYESDLQTATVNLRTAKIQLLMLTNDRTPSTSSM